MSQTFCLKLDGPAEVHVIEEALAKASVHFNGAQFNSALSFAMSFLVTLIVIYEQTEPETRGSFDYELLLAKLKAAVVAGHGGSH